MEENVSGCFFLNTVYWTDSLDVKMACKQIITVR